MLPAADLLQEANHCFELNVNLFASFSVDTSLPTPALATKLDNGVKIASKRYSIDALLLPAMLFVSTLLLLFRYYQPLRGFVIALLA